MERFAPALRRVARDLDVPRRARTALLLEMAADLEAVFEHHRSRGLSEADAVQRAEETILGSTEVIRRLGRLYASPWRGWSEELAARLTGGVDVVLLVAGVLPVVALAGAVSAWALAGAGSPLVWAVVVIGLLMSVVVGVEVARMLRGRPARAGALPVLLVLAALASGVGVLAVALGLQATALEISSAGAAFFDSTAPVTLANRVARDGGALLMGLLLGITGVLAWFILLSREARRADREVEALLADGPPPDPALRRGGEPNAILPLTRRRYG